MPLLTCFASATLLADKHHVVEEVDEEYAASFDLQVDEQAEVRDAATFASFSKVLEMSTLRPLPTLLSTPQQPQVSAEN